MATFFPLTESVVIVKKFVLDADTFQFKYNKMIRTRAGFIDTPELKYKDDPSQKPQDLNQWEWGAYTKTFFLSLTHRKNICVIPHGGLDIFGRAVADWYLCDGFAPLRYDLKIFPSQIIFSTFLFLKAWQLLFHQIIQVFCTNRSKLHKTKPNPIDRASGMMMSLCCRTFGKLPDKIIYLLPVILQAVF